ncbi:hypothetical protein [Sulfitobacter aestuariivivens]|uniref:YMGG-like Gly-zipper domain-containing protein n=1 Tax=Sulfitobacter aestuariivivens TaxID=2766981 RepID=A0A927HDV8_9RHOB|nr:hypothetical protein [Sulfitobacter aestuariivivens]MBD3662694.1 hypothetical protein [Sulfitobacter aestuariivivens]
MSFKSIALVAVLCGTLAACGDTISEQALAGGAIGAGTAVLVNGSLAKGAAIGAAGNLAYCQLNPGKCRGY